MRSGIRKALKLVFIIVAAAILPTGMFAQETGAAAFAARDYAKAEQLWAQEAAQGAAEAVLGLGVLADSGARRPANPQAAFGWYLTAARMGLAEGQMNVALSYDTGLGQDRDLEQALAWYTRAALRGHTEAQQNLALMYAVGASGNMNVVQARYWFDQAGVAHDLPTTQDVSTLAAPQVIFDDVTSDRIEIVWQATASSSPLYQLEVLDAAADGSDYQPPVFTTETAGSGLLITDIVLPDNVIWRVINMAENASDYRAEPWHGATQEDLPKGRIILVADDAIPGMVDTAAVFAQDLRAAGYWVRLSLESQDSANAGLGTYVSYGFQSDIALADLTARYLPGPSDGLDYVQRPGRTRPGEVIVHLAAKTAAQ